MNETLRAAAALALTATAWVPGETDDGVPPRVEIAREAEAVRPLVATRFARAYLNAAGCLPAIDDRVVYRRASDRAIVLTAAERAVADDDVRDDLTELTLDERFYYTTRYGTPIANVRAYDLAAAHGLASPAAARVADFGFGSIGSLRILASLGAHAVGIEVDPTLRALYAQPGDTGPIPRCPARDAGQPGTITLAFGRWPGEDDVRHAVSEAAGPGLDLFLSKNTLKRGYIHPHRAFRSRAAGAGLIDLGADDRTYVHAVRDVLAPGGLFLIYDLCPKLVESDAGYKPWADGRCPFDRTLLEEAGFEIIAYDVDDTAMAQLLARALGWPEQGMDVEGDLFAMYTLLRRRE